VEVFLNDVSPDVFAAVVAYIYQDDALVRHSTNVTLELITSRVDAVVRTLAFHQCSLSSIPSSYHARVEFIDSIFCSERILPKHFGFPRSPKT